MKSAQHSPRKPLIVAPSLLAGDFSQLGLEVQRIEATLAQAIHLDVADGHFVPNITFGPDVVKAVRAHTALFLDVHLMIQNPLHFVDAFIASGADRLIVHVESNDFESALKAIKNHGIEAGVALRPETPLSLVEPYLPYCDSVLLMTVNPGFGGQEFMADVLSKISTLAKKVNRAGLRLDIQVDGGINLETARLSVGVGANFLIAGTYLLCSDAMAERIASMKKLADA